MDTYMIIGWIIVVSFYTSYFTKMLLQKTKGIKTDRMARGSKPKKTYLIEASLKLITYSTALVQLVSMLLLQQLPIIFTSFFLRIIGVFISFVGIAFFILAMATMKDSWRAGIDVTEKTKLITSGVYKYSRNPAFLGFDLFYIGFVLMFSNGLILLFSVAAIIMLHLQIMEEEKFLPLAFGEDYLEYKKRTSRYFIIF
ncbi:MAG: isoprenylcysteine carboxylmethyltransferase family protein [Ruminiclostridium sp.]|nr:isoprenylcysteine carboxylmethyltransferase family protein [Ruminiclostridium sp.]